MTDRVVIGPSDESTARRGVTSGIVPGACVTDCRLARSATRGHLTGERP